MLKQSVFKKRLQKTKKVAEGKRWLYNPYLFSNFYDAAINICSNHVSELSYQKQI